MGLFKRRRRDEDEATRGEKRPGKKRAKRPRDEGERAKKHLFGHDGARNSEVTVQLDGERPVVDTAMATHIGTRDYQQDAAYVSEALYGPGYAFGILCDGMGGMDSGELVSAEVVELMANGVAALLAEPEAEKDIPAFFHQIIPKVNDIILDHYAQDGQEPGSTLVSVIVKAGGPGEDGYLYWASVGDSRIYILRGGEMAQMTRDHNYALELQQHVDAGRLSQAEADANPQREALVSYTGAPALELVDVGKEPFGLRAGDVVMLCSDGLTKSLADEEILRHMEQHDHSLGQAARLLPLAAFDASPGGQDNTSVILMQYNGPQGLNDTEPIIQNS